jgi:signal transduction histidine kinase
MIPRSARDKLQQRLTLRTKILLYFVIVHLIVAAAAVFVLMENRLLLFIVEALFAASVYVSYRLVRALFVPLDLIRTGAELITERDFSSRFVEVGQPEMDSLIRVYNDMAERLRDERLAAEEQQQLLQKIVAASPSGIVICGFDGNVEQMNPAAERLVTPEVREAMEAIAPGESRLVTAAGRRLKVWRAEFRDRGFRKTFFLVEELTEELRLSEKSAYEKLIRMMSHEVNNSVGAVRSLLESSLRYAPQVGDADRPDFTNALTVASARIDSLNRFMAAFADVVRIPPPHRAMAALAPIVSRIAALVRPEVEERNIRMTQDLDPAFEASVDASQFEQVVLNIVRNAIDAVDRDGEVAISLRDRTLLVADSGPGIDAAAAPELFTPFFSTKRNGRGLGLTIVQEILANHGFGFALRNRDACGAEFVVWF